MRLLEQLARLGGVARDGALAYRTACPACGAGGSLPILVTAFGERPGTCRAAGCTAFDVRAALDRLPDQLRLAERPLTAGAEAGTAASGGTSTAAGDPAHTNNRRRTR